MMISADGVPTTSDAVTPADQLPSLSFTRKVMVWVPAESVEVEKEAVVPMVPFMEEVHSQAAMVPSVSVPWPVRVTDSPGEAGLGVMESMAAVGAVFPETKVNFTASAQVLKVSPVAAVIVTEPLPSK